MREIATVTRALVDDREKNNTKDKCNDTINKTKNTVRQLNIKMYNTLSLYIYIYNCIHQNEQEK